MRSSPAAALALIAAVLGGAIVLVVGSAAGWLHGGSTKTVVVRAPAPTAGDAAAPVVAAKPLLGNGFQPAQIYRARSAGAQSALGRRPATERVFKPALHHLADRIGARLRAKSLVGRTLTVRVRFADLRSVTRSLTLSAPISATRALAEIAEDLVRGALADHPDERTISLLAITVSHLEAHAIVQLELPLGLADEGRRPGTKRGLARSRADRAIDAIRKRFGETAVNYGAEVRGARSVPDEFRRLAEKEL